MAVSLMTVVSAVSGLNVALPSLARDTGASQTQLTWIVDAYTVVFAGLLLFTGSLGDRFGRRGLLLAGLAVFGIAAGLAMTTDDPALLIALRAAMGVGAACIMPTTLSVITTSFPEHERPRAIGVWVGIAGGGAVLGLFGTGLLLEHFAWNSFFALNVGLAVLGLAGTLAVVPTSKDADAPPLDLAGGAALPGRRVRDRARGDRGSRARLARPGHPHRDHRRPAGRVGFVLWELRRPHPMLDPRLFALRGFGSGSLSITVQFFAAFGFFFAILQYLQFVVGLSPLQAAIRLLPLPVVLIPLARTAPRLAVRLGFRRLGPLGLA